MRNVLKILFFLFIVCGLLFIVASSAQAQAFGNEQLTNFGQTAGYGEASLSQIIGRIVKIVLGLLGLAAVIIMIIGGFLWMSSGGNPEKIAKAKKVITSALIGLLIIVFAYAVVSFIMAKLSGVTGFGSESGEACTPGLCCGPGMRCGASGVCDVSDSSCSLPPDTFRIRKIETTHGGLEQNYNQDVYLCSAVQPIFNHSVKGETIQDLSDAGELKIEGVSGAWQTRNNVVIFKHPELFATNTSYQAYFPKAILDTQGKILRQCLAAGGCVETGSYFIWNFTTGETVDIIPPVITAAYPVFDPENPDYPDQNISRKPDIEVGFSEAIDITTVADENNYPIETNVWIAELDGQNGAIVTTSAKEIFEVKGKDNGFRLKLRDENLLKPFTWYRIHLENIEDLCLNKMSGAVEWEFQTNGNVPGISSQYPSGNQECPDTDISVVFNTQMYDNLVRFEISGGDNFVFEMRPSELESPYEKRVTGGIFKVGDPGTPIDNHFRIFTFNPDNNLQSNSDYRVKVFTDLVINQQGTLLSHTWTFSTATLETCLCSPWISRLDPEQGLRGDCITVYGQCFKGTAFQTAELKKLEFILNETPTEASIGGFSDNYITTVVPDVYSKGNRPKVQATIKYQSGELTSNAAEFYVKSGEEANGPCLLSISPQKGYSNETTVNLSGLRFGEKTGSSRVVFYNNIPATYQTWFETGINDALVPLGAEDGSVAVVNAQGTSNGLPFDVLQHINGPGQACQESANCPVNPPYACAEPVYHCLYKSPDTCRCCCNPGVNSCLSPLKCMANQGKCTGDNRGLCCGCQNDAQCGGNLGCGVLDPNKCCYSRPSIRIFSPTGNNVCLNAAVEIEFSQTMDKISLNKDNIRLTKVSGGEKMDFDLVINQDNDKIILFPKNCLLSANTAYKAELTGGSDGTGIRDAMGVSMDDYAWQFTTGNENNFCEVDYVSVSPNAATVKSFKETVNYTASGYDDKGTQKYIEDDVLVCVSEFSWSSGDVSIAMVNPGQGLQTVASPVGGQGKQTINITAAVSGTSGRGEFTSILSPPMIIGLGPNSGTNNPAIPTYVTVSGRGFGQTQGNSVVKFGDTAAKIGCNNWSDTEIVVIVPEGLIMGNDYTVTVTNPEQGVSNGQTFRVRNEFHPAICQLKPNKGETGTQIDIQGINFADEMAKAGKIDFGNVFQGGAELKKNSNEILSWSNKNIKIKAPEVPEQEPRITVYVPSPIETGNPLKPSNPVSFYRQPVISSITPDKGPKQTWVTIKGRNFGSVPGKVYFQYDKTDYPADDLPDYCPTAWTDQMIVVAAPESLLAVADNKDFYQTKVYVKTVNNIESNSIDWQVNKNPLPPALCQISPSNGYAGFYPLTLKGQGFMLKQGEIGKKLIFSKEKEAVSITWTSDTEISNVIVPDGVQSGEVKVIKQIRAGCRLKCSGLSFAGECFGNLVEVCEETLIESNPLFFDIVDLKGCGIFGTLESRDGKPIKVGEKTGEYPPVKPFDSQSIGVLATDGKYLYAKSWGGYDRWAPGSYGCLDNTGCLDNIITKIGTGYQGTVAGQIYGDLADVHSSLTMTYYPDGYLYNGYTTDGHHLERINVETGEIDASVNIPAGLLVRETGQTATGAYNNHLITSDGNYIYNLAYSLGNGYNGFRVKIFDPRDNWKLVREWDSKGSDYGYDVDSFYTDGIIADGDYIYAIEWWGGRIRKMNALTGQIEAQWISDQKGRTNPDGNNADFISGQYDWVNNKIWLGDLVDWDRCDQCFNAYYYGYYFCHCTPAYVYRYDCGGKNPPAIPKDLPRVIEDSTCEKEIQSPSPRHLSSQGCANALILARFNTKMNPDTLVNPNNAFIHPNIIVQKCNSGSEKFNDQSCNTEVNGGISLAEFGNQGFVFTPSSSLDKNYWYKITLKSGSGGIKDAVKGYQLDGNKNGLEEGSPNDDYFWYFKIKNQGETCLADRVEISEQVPVGGIKGLIIKPGIRNYTGLPIGPDCQILNPNSFVWAWNSTNQAVATVAGGALSYTAIATAVDLGETKIQATATPLIGGPTTGSSDLVVATYPRVIGNFPADGRTDVCRNTVISATFDQEMDPTGFQNNISVSPLTPSFGISFSPDKKTVNLETGLLDSGLTYRVTIKGPAGVKSKYGVKPLADYSWKFTTKELCQLAKVEIEPNTISFTKTGSSEGLTAYAKDNRGDEIQGIPGVYNWTWSWKSSDAAVVSVKGSSSKNETATAQIRNGRAQIIATASIVGSKPVVSVSGQAQVDVFLCDIPWIFEDSAGPGSSPNTRFKLSYCRGDYPQGIYVAENTGWSSSSQSHSRVGIAKNESYTGSDSLLIHQDPNEPYPGICSLNACKGTGTGSWPNSYVYAPNCFWQAGSPNKCNLPDTPDCGICEFNEGAGLGWPWSNRVMWARIAYNTTGFNLKPGQEYTFSFFYKGRLASSLSILMCYTLSWCGQELSLSYCQAAGACTKECQYINESEEVRISQGNDPCCKCRFQQWPYQTQGYSNIYLGAIPAGNYPEWKRYAKTFTYTEAMTKTLNRSGSLVNEVGMSIGYNDTGALGTDIYIDEVQFQKKEVEISILPKLTAASIQGSGDLIKEFLFSVGDSGDVIGLKVFNNPKRLTPLNWYKENVPNPGNPKSFLIDNYFALQEGRTVYVGATNVDGNNIYNYVYLISYNDEAKPETIKIFNQLLDNWQFNVNLSDYVESKAEIQNDLLRIYDFQEIKDKLRDYYQTQRKYPDLGAGTYISGQTNSKWPSWQNTLGKALGKSLPIDPLNNFKTDSGPCAGCPNEPGQPNYQCQGACYNSLTGIFDHPNGSHVYQYYAPQNKDCLGRYYTLKLNLEYGNGGVVWKGENDVITLWPDLNNTFNYVYNSPETPVCGDGILQCGEDCDCGDSYQSCCSPSQAGYCPGTKFPSVGFVSNKTCENMGYKISPTGFSECNGCIWGGNSCSRKTDGEPTDAPNGPSADCHSGWAYDGVCCNVKCDGLCKYCGGADGGTAGVCHNVARGGDPRGVCNDTSGCLTGNCDGAGACTDYYNSGDRNCLPCRTCDGAVSGICVNRPDDSQDIVEPNFCQGVCKKCSGGSCVNQTELEDLFNQCELNWNACDNLCVRRGADGYCDGSGACDTNDRVGNIASGYVCTIGGEATAVSSSNYCGSESVCSANTCQGTNWYRSCSGSGSCRAVGDHTNAYSTPINAALGNILNASCGQTAGYCALCHKCDGSGTCQKQNADGLAATVLGCSAGSEACRRCYIYNDQVSCTYYTSGQRGCPSNYVCNSSGNCILNVYNISGNVTDPMTGLGINGASVVLKIRTTGTPLKSTFTDTNGDYQFTNVVYNNTADYYKIEVSKDGYSSASDTFSLTSNLTKDFSISASLEPAGAVRIVLTWGSVPVDLDTHLQFGDYYVYFNSKSEGGATLDVDDQTSYGPETITINSLQSGITYKYSVRHFKAGGTWTANAKVEVYNSNGAKVKECLHSGFNKDKYWYVFDINGSNGNISDCKTTIQDSLP